MDAETTIAGEPLRLLPERAAYLPRTRTLLVADTHWGKDAAFRAAAIPIATDLQRADLERLTDALMRTGTERLVILGDLLHASHARREATGDLIRRWRARHASLAVVAVSGNHDRHAGRPLADWDVRADADELLEPPFVLRHHPDPDPAGYVLAGHLHPKAVLSGPGRQSLALPCFWFGAAVGVLPAFNSFTGGAEVRPAPGDRVFVIAGGDVLPVGRADRP